MKFARHAAGFVEFFIAVAAATVFGYLMFSIGKAQAHNDAVWDALTNGPPAPALELSDEFLAEFMEGKIDLEMLEEHGYGISYEGTVDEGQASR